MATVTFDQESTWAVNARLIESNPRNYVEGKDTLSFPKLAKMGVGHYIGRVTELKGRLALVHVQCHEAIAQFNDYDTGLCYGQHKFIASDFDIHYYEDGTND